MQTEAEFEVKHMQGIHNLGSPNPPIEALI